MSNGRGGRLSRNSQGRRGATSPHRYAAVWWAAGVAFGGRGGRVTGRVAGGVFIFSMILSFLRRGTLSGFAALGRRQREVMAWVRARPRVAAWFEPVVREQTADEAYREFNLHYFASFREQERMLADGPRMEFYHAMIEREVRPGDEVIDLGTGTGILAAWAARRGAARVHAIDHSAVLEYARLVAAHNRVERVEFTAVHSREFKLPHQVDVIVHEQMGDFLFDEAMVANVVDLRDRLLKPGGRILPHRFELFCEPVQVRAGQRVPFIWELNVKGFDYTCLERERPQETDYYCLTSCDQQMVERFLGEPAPAMEVDLLTIKAGTLPASVTLRRTVREAGRLDGFAVFFNAGMAEGPRLSSSPLEAGRAPHWGFRILRVEAEEYAAGEVIEVTLSAEDWARRDNWRWTHRRAAGRIMTNDE